MSIQDTLTPYLWLQESEDECFDDMGLIQLVEDWEGGGPAVFVDPIVQRATNAHEGLVEALNWLATYPLADTDHPALLRFRDVAREALAKAKETD